MIKTRKVESALWIGMICLMVILLMSHAYNDIIITTRHGINFWNILKDGKLLQFYETNRVVSGNVHYDVLQSCAYNILVYIVFAIWNLPLYFLETFAGIDVMNSIPCLVYSKLLIVSSAILTAIILKKILEALEIPEEYHNRMVYLYMTSALLIPIIFITSQYDILSLIFQLLGFLAFIKSKDKAFVFWFGVAFCFKFFSAIIFLPLLLLRHKKVISWIKSLAMMLFPWFLTRIPFWIYGVVGQSAQTLTSGGEAAAGRLMTRILTSGNISNGANLFMIVYAAILIWCYLQNTTSKQRGHCAVWGCMLAYVAFFGLLEALPYWSILLAPFVTLSIAMVPKQLYLNTILETVGYAGLFGVNILRYNAVYFGHSLKSMIWSRILAGSRFFPGYEGSIVEVILWGLYDRTDIHAVVNSVFLAAMCALAYTTYPRCNSGGMISRNGVDNCNDVLIIRFFVNTIMCLLPILAIFI